MNYLNIYNKFIDYFKSTTPKERLSKRDINDIRLSEKYIYTEKHHINPKYEGIDNSLDNLVELLPEEHIFIHFLRFKVFENINDYYAFRFSLNTITKKDITLKTILNKKLRRNYSYRRNIAYKLRIEKKYHSDKTLNTLRNLLKNKIIVKDSVTGKLIGKVDKNNSNVISGKWVHHTKGMHSFIDTRTNEKVYIDIKDKKEYHIVNHHSQKGINNTNYSKVTDDEILSYYDDFFEKYNLIPYLDVIRKIYNDKIPIHLKSDFRFVNFGGGKNGLYNILYLKYNLRPTRTFSKKMQNILKELKTNENKN